MALFEVIWKILRVRMPNCHLRTGGSKPGAYNHEPPHRIWVQKVPLCKQGFLGDTLNAAGNSMTKLREALSGTTSEKRGVPSRTEGERSLDMLWSHHMPWIIGLWFTSRTLEGNSRKSSESFSGVFPDFFSAISPRNQGKTKGQQLKGKIVS